MLRNLESFGQIHQGGLNNVAIRRERHEIPGNPNSPMLESEPAQNDGDNCSLSTAFVSVRAGEEH